MPAPLPAPIRTYQPETYLRRFMPDPAAFSGLLTPAAERFFIVPVEQMYQHFTRGGAPARSTAHSCLLLTSGTARMHIGTESYTAGPGEVLLVRAGQVYSFAPGDVNTGLLCHFHDDFVLGPGESPGSFSVLQFWGAPFIRLDALAAGFAEQLLRRLLADYQAHGLQHADLLRAYLRAFLHELVRADSTSATTAAPNAAAGLTQRFLQLVATSLRTSHRVDDYAARLHVSAGHLGKCVRHVTGKAPAKWIEESQVLEAKVLLYQSPLTVGEIALEVGLADASYFSRLFKKHTGLTPLAFRRQMHAS
ncbi:AraC family transcriptional regulator [Hymenobacter sp. CRA2]|uniref:AraC family transcriptional regulator n=1 Tax=Hymenobacter sp. CRA2 TaxID=1955620 RepID=UPI0009C5F2F1|nr:AraC family transcriptional regulator [Hymenobacter sp. CRA2]OON66995.1 hypothetical protein B0919_20675 [Hymenobacter sp. CRA2]